MLVLAHYDTVHPVGTTERKRARIESDKLFGPGTYDMKVGAYLARAHRGVDAAAAVAVAVAVSAWVVA